MNKYSLQKAVKRAMDIGIAVTLLLLLWPLILLIWLIVRWTMGCSAIFRQKRPGLQGRPFLLYKFRTMNNVFGPDCVLRPDAERLTKLGSFLRRTSLDELPQLWNVLRGDMSLVGPRPLRTDYLPYFTKREQLRHSVLPGITGWAQINGRNELAWDRRLAHDVWYVEHWCLWLDLKILFHTAIRVLHCEDVVIDPNSKMMDLNVERAYMSTESHNT